MTKNERFMKLQRIYKYLMYRDYPLDGQALRVITEAQRKVLYETDL